MHDAGRGNFRVFGQTDSLKRHAMFRRERLQVANTEAAFGRGCVEDGGLSFGINF
jgi:hypothetical protein